MKGKLARLHLPGPGRRILNRIEVRSKTNAASDLEVIRELIENLCDNPHLPWHQLTPWNALVVPYSALIPETRRRGTAPSRFNEPWMVETHLVRNIPGFERIYTDESVRTGVYSATATFTTPVFAYEWKGKLAESRLPPLQSCRPSYRQNPK